MTELFRLENRRPRPRGGPQVIARAALISSYAGPIHAARRPAARPGHLMSRDAEIGLCWRGRTDGAPQYGMLSEGGSGRGSAPPRADASRAGLGQLPLSAIAARIRLPSGAPERGCLPIVETAA